MCGPLPPRPHVSIFLETQILATDFTVDGFLPHKISVSLKKKFTRRIYFSNKSESVATVCLTAVQYAQSNTEISAVTAVMLAIAMVIILLVPRRSP
jgi:hypothetical protein